MSAPSKRDANFVRPPKCLGLTENEAQEERGTKIAVRVCTNRQKSWPGRPFTRTIKTKAENQRFWQGIKFAVRVNRTEATESQARWQEVHFWASRYGETSVFGSDVYKQGRAV